MSKEAAKTVTVVVCDPCPLICAGLLKNFENDARIRITGETRNLRLLCQKVVSEQSDIALVDWSMISWHDDDCMKVINEISSHTFLVLLGMTETTRDRKRALEFGSRGIISKRSSASQIRRALCRIARGGIWLEHSAAETLLDDVFSPPKGPEHDLERIETLTRREREVIELVCRSLRNKDIAATLYISESTVWHHLTSIFAKLQISDRVSLVTFAYRNNLSSFVDPIPPATRVRPSPLFLRRRDSEQIASIRTLPEELSA
jgi:two-component system nitrate/nitrite response regulator NarL